MKTPIRFIAFAAALPLALVAQSSSSGSSTSGSSSGSSDRSSSSSANYPSSSSTSPSSSSSRSSTSPDSSSSSMSARSGDMNSSSGMSGSGVAGIDRLTQREVDSQLTAKALIGKNVYDNAGKRVGEVKDIVLDSSRAPQLAGVVSGHDRDNASNTSSTSTSRPSSAGAATTSGGYASTSGSDSSSTRSSGSSDTMSNDISRASSALQGMASSLTSSGPSAIISSGGFLGMGDNLLRVPLTQLSYDSGSDHITLNVSQEELSSLTNDRSSTRSAAE